MQLSSDVLEFIQLLNKEEVEYLIVGGWALAFHARPRYTKDIDIFIAVNPTNASKLISVLKQFGMDSLDISEGDFLTKGQIIQLGLEPNRIDLLTAIAGVNFSEEWANKESYDHQGIKLNVISKKGLIKNKKSVARSQDLVDVSILERQSKKIK